MPITYSLSAMTRTTFYCPTCHAAMIAAVSLPCGKPPVRHIRFENLAGERITACPQCHRDFSRATAEQFEDQLARNW